MAVTPDCIKPFNLAYTIFKDLQASKLEVVCETWPDLIARLTKPPTYLRKQDCPLLAMRTFTGQRTPQGSLRHANAVSEVSAIEIDYDQGDLGVTDALQRLTDNGITALIYSTPSHYELDDKGQSKGARWRCICPLSEPIEPHSRAFYVAALNHIFDGALAPESFSLAQSYFFGQVKGVKFEAGAVEGAFIDAVALEREMPTLFPATLPADGAIRDLDLIDPALKTGPVGAFSQVFSPADVLGELLAPRFEQVTPTRWSWVNRPTAQGVWIKDNHIGGSHASWPGGSMRLSTAFDIFRLFMFNDAQPETELDQQVPMAQRPSYIAAVDWMRARPEFTEFFKTHQSAGQDAPIDWDAELEKLQAAQPHQPLPPSIETNQANETIATTESIGQGYALKTFNDLLNTTPVSWQIKHLLPKQSLALLYGASGSGKSFVALDLALSMARGQAWGYPLSACRVKPGGCIYVAAEGAGGMGQRVSAYTAHNQITQADLICPFAVITAAPNLADKTDVARIMFAAKTQLETPPAVIILDTFAQVTPGLDENSKEIQRAITMANALISEIGCSVIIIHHAGKDESRGARGWSGIRAAVDTELHVVRDEVEDGDPPQWLLQVTKQKDGQDGLKYWFELKHVVTGTDDDGDDVGSLVVSHLPATDAHGNPRRLTDKPKGGKRKNGAEDAAPLLGAREQILFDAIVSQQQWVSREQSVDVVNTYLETEGQKPLRRDNIKRSFDSLLKKAQRVGLEAKKSRGRGGDGMALKGRDEGEFGGENEG